MTGSKSVMKKPAKNIPIFKLLCKYLHYKDLNKTSQAKKGIR